MELGERGGADASEVETAVLPPPPPPLSIGPFLGFRRLAEDNLTDLCGESCNLAEGIAFELEFTDGGCPAGLVGDSRRFQGGVREPQTERFVLTAFVCLQYVSTWVGGRRVSKRRG